MESFKNFTIFFENFKVFSAYWKMCLYVCIDKYGGISLYVYTHRSTHTYV